MLKEIWDKETLYNSIIFGISINVSEQSELSVRNFWLYLWGEVAMKNILSHLALKVLELTVWVK